jgi:hypothetical protein
MPPWLGLGLGLGLTLTLGVVVKQDAALDVPEQRGVSKGA